MAENATDPSLSGRVTLPALPSRKSLFWKGLNDSAACIDIWKAFEGNQDAIQEWLRMLRQGGDLTITLNPTEENIPILRHIYTENRNVIKTKGPQSFGFGYPLVFDFIESSPEDPLVAPLFVWNFTINAHASKPDAWIINRSEAYPVIVNEAIFEYIYLHYHLDLRKVVRQLAYEGKLRQTTLQEIMDDVSGVLNNGEEISVMPAGPFPDRETRIEWARTGLLFDAGFFGIFEPSCTRRLSEPVKARLINDKMDSVDVQKLHDIGFTPLDPFQKAVLRNAQKYEVTVVEGSSGTGKTHTLVNMVGNALSMGQRCLVISSAVASLKKMQKDLSAKGLAHLVMLYDDEYLDKNLLLELLKLEAEGKEIAWDAPLYQKIFDQARRLDNQAELSFQSLYTPIFGDENWAETVGRFLASNRIHGKELLFSQLNPSDFTFSREEFDRLIAVIQEAEPLFDRVKTLKHPLKVLHADLFRQMDADDAHAYAQDQLSLFSQKISALQHRYIQKTYDYTEKIHEYYDNHFDSFHAEGRKLEQRIAHVEVEYGKNALKTGVLNRILQWLSPRARRLQREKRQIWTDFETLKRNFEQAKYYEFPFPPADAQHDLSRLAQSLASFSGALQHWKQKLPTLIQEEIQRLNSQNVHSDIDFQEQIEELEYALDLLTEEINNARLFQEPVSNKMLTIPKRQQFLEDLQEHMDTTLQNLRDFSVFYPWQKGWLPLQDKEKKLIAALVRIKPANWVAAFESWFFQNRLSLDFTVHMPQDDALLDQFRALYPALESGFPSYIAHLWLEKRRSATRELKKNQKDALISRNNTEAFKGMSAFDVFSSAPRYITEVFPVMLATPQVASEVLSVGAAHWDMILIDDSQALDRDLGMEILTLGKRAVIMGNESTTLPDAPPTLFHELVDSCEQIWPLRILHRRNTIPLLRLTNAYRIQPPILLRSASATSDCIEIRECEGLFDTETATNPLEAEAILTYLLQLTASGLHRVFPAVAIVAMNESQRNLLNAMLLEIKQTQAKGHEMIGQLQRNGLGVFCLHEMEGQHFDLVLFSGTIQTLRQAGLYAGPKPAEPAHEAFFELLLSRPREKLVLFLSFEKKWMTQILGKKGPSPDAYQLLYQAIRTGTSDQSVSVPSSNGLDTASPLPYSASPYSNAHRLKMEIACSLYPYLEKGRVHLDTVIDYMTFPITIKPVYEHQPPFVILVGGCFSDGPASALAWENAVRMEMDQMGLPYAATYAANWWTNPRQEARRLASLIVRNDNMYAGNDDSN